MYAARSSDNAVAGIDAALCDSDFEKLFSLSMFADCSGFFTNDVQSTHHQPVGEVTESPLRKRGLELELQISSV